MSVEEYIILKTLGWEVEYKDKQTVEISTTTLSNHSFSILIDTHKTTVSEKVVEMEKNYNPYSSPLPLSHAYSVGDKLEQLACAL